MLRIRLAVLATAVALVAAVLVVAQRGDWFEDGDDRAELSGASSVTLKGRGYGHGRGLSQYGAQGAAVEHGRNYRQIIDAYYPGTAWGSRHGRIKVKITANHRPVIRVRDRSHLRARALRTGQRWTLDRPGAQKWRIKRVAGNLTRLSVRVAGTWHKVRDVRGGMQFNAGGRPLAFRVSGEWRHYRGKLRLPGSGDTVNILAIEKYLRGVVPREMPALWHPEAVKAQAVAARTYAQFEKRQARQGGHQPFHVYDTVASQVYGGYDDEHPASTDAIQRTRRQVRLYDGAPAFTQFSASNGGWTVQGSVPYQRARRDRWDRWSGNPHRSWRATIRDQQLERAYPSIGDFRRVVIRDRWRDGNGRWGGRALKVRIVGSDGRVTVSGSDFRFRFGLKSTWLRVV